MIQRTKKKPVKTLEGTGPTPTPKNAIARQSAKPTQQATQTASNTANQVAQPVAKPIVQQIVKPTTTVPVSKTDNKHRPILNTPKLSSLFNQDFSKTTETEDEEIAPQDIKTTEFSEEQLIQAWQEFASRFIKENSSFYNTLLSQKPVVGDNFKIEFSVSSKTQVGDFDKEKIEFVRFLREKLANTQITLNINLEEGSQQTHIPFSPLEKFKLLVEKNPLAQDLKKQLDLEIE